MICSVCLTLSCIETKQGGKGIDLSLSMEEIIHECKLFFAGHENTSLLLTCQCICLVFSQNGKKGPGRRF